MYICNFLVFVATREKNEQVGKYLCNGKFRFEFPETSFDEYQWQSIFRNFRKRVQPYEVYQNFRKLFTGCEFPFHLTFRPEFPVQLFAFRKFNYFRIVCILSQEYLVLFVMSPFQNFRNFWLNGKRPWLSKIPWRHYLNSQSMQIQFHNEPITPSRQFTVNLCNCRNARERLATTVKWGKAVTAPSVM